MKNKPVISYEIEQSLHNAGYRLVCGVDEAGRGPLAGAVYAAAVILPAGFVPAKLNDSKKVSEAVRERLFDEITGSAVAYSIATASVEEIEQVNILGAAMLSMRRAVEGLTVVPDYILVDGNRLPGALTIPARAVVGGDGLSFSIAAASILAKVSRDRYMKELDKAYPQYGFAQHKGYGTKAHTDAILEYGICPEHRPSFLKKLFDRENPS